MTGKLKFKFPNSLAIHLEQYLNWCIPGNANNLDGLKDKRMEGNYRKATEEYIKILLDTIDKNPQEMGDEFRR